MSSTSRAIICTGKGEAAVKEVPVPSIREGHVLIKAKALGLNPTDWKSIHSDDAGGTKIGVCIGLIAPRQPSLCVYETSALLQAHKRLTCDSATTQAWLKRSVRV